LHFVYRTSSLYNHDDLAMLQSTARLTITSLILPHTVFPPSILEEIPYPH
jgi:hypothetical protein